MKKVTLGQVIMPAKVVRCGDNDYPVLSMTMHNGIVLQSDRFNKSLASNDKSNYKVVYKNQLVVGFPIDEGVLYVQKCQPVGIMSPAYNVWDIDTTKIKEEFLELVLHSPKAMQYYADNLRGSTARRRSIPTSTLLAYEFILPSLDVQEKYIEIINKQNTLIEIKKQQYNNLEILIKSRFVELFECGSYPVFRLGDVCTKITDGTHKTPNYLDSGVTFISAKNIVNGELDFTDVKYISEQEYAEIQKRCQTEMGDILLSKSGSLGVPAIIKTADRIGLFESLAVLKYDRRRLLADFLCEQLKSDKLQRQFRVGTKGVAIKHLHLGVIADTKIIVPPLELQQQFAEFAMQVEKAKQVIKEQLAELETLKKSLMQKYFG